MINEAINKAFKFLLNILVFFYKQIGLVIEWVANYITTFGVITIFGILFYYFGKRFQKKLAAELIKRKEILHDIDLYLKTHPHLTEKIVVKNDEYAVSKITEKKYPDEYYDKLNYIAEKRWNAKPEQVLYALFLYVFVLFIFVSFIPYLEGKHLYNNFILIFGLTISLQIIQYLFSKNKNKVEIFFIIFIAFIYWNIPYELLLMFFVSGLIKTIEKIKQYKSS